MLLLSIFLFLFVQSHHRTRLPIDRHIHSNAPQTQNYDTMENSNISKLMSIVLIYAMLHFMFQSSFTRK